MSYNAVSNMQVVTKKKSYPAVRETWTVEPDSDVKSLMTKEINRRVGIHGDKRGQRSKILNEAVRAFLVSLIGKREGNLK